LEKTVFKQGSEFGVVRIEITILALHVIFLDGTEVEILLLAVAKDGMIWGFFN
jgi:hypothetical protein